MTNELSCIMPFYSESVSKMIIDKYGLDENEALRKFLFSETYQILIRPELEMWEFSPPAIFDLWEAEKVTGDPRNSVYIRGE